MVASAGAAGAAGAVASTADAGAASFGASAAGAAGGGGGAASGAFIGAGAGGGGASLLQPARVSAASAAISTERFMCWFLFRKVNPRLARPLRPVPAISSYHHSLPLYLRWGPSSSPRRSARRRRSAAALPFRPRPSPAVRRREQNRASRHGNTHTAQSASDALAH